MELFYYKYTRKSGNDFFFFNNSAVFSVSFKSGLVMINKCRLGSSGRNIRSIFPEADVPPNFRLLVWTARCSHVFTWSCIFYEIWDIEVLKLKWLRPASLSNLTSLSLSATCWGSKGTLRTQPRSSAREVRACLSWDISVGRSVTACTTRVLVGVGFSSGF